MQTSLMNFRDAAISEMNSITGGGSNCPPPPCTCPPPKKKGKGNNGLGNGGDPPPPGLAKQPRQDFNDGFLGDGD